MPRSALTGSRIRERRTLLGIKQSELARSVEISPSYLNLIEHNRRRIAGKLLTEIARELQVEVAQLTRGAEAELLDQMSQAAADLPSSGAELERIDELVGRFPGWAALVQAQHRRIHDLQDRIESLSDRLSHDPRLSSAMHEVLSKATAIRSASSILVETEDIDDAWRRRFHRNLHGDSLALAESAQALTTFLDGEGAVQGESGTPWEELELFLESHRFHFADLESGAGVQDVMPEAGTFSPSATILAETYLSRYRREAEILPLSDVEAALGAGQADPTTLASQLNLPLAMILRRLAAAPQQPGQDPFGLVLCDGTGTILMRKPTDGFLVPRTGSACPLWPVYEAMATPGRPVSRRLTHSSTSGVPVIAYAVAEPRWPYGTQGPSLTEAWMILIPETEKKTAMPPLPVGSACRVCVLNDCLARQEPSVMSAGF